MKGTRIESGGKCGALSALFDNPATLVERLRRSDRDLISALEALKQVTPANVVGGGIKNHFSGLTDQKAGKLIKVFFEAASDEHLGQGMKVILGACLAGQKQ